MADIGSLVASIGLAHMVGDYVIQSHWMAVEKTKRWWPAIAHGVTYGLPFLLITQSALALAIIVGTHILIDHWRLARFAVWIRNQLAPKAYRPALTSGCRQPHRYPGLVGGVAAHHRRQRHSRTHQPRCGALCLTPNGSAMPAAVGRP